MSHGMLVHANRDRPKPEFDVDARKSDEGSRREHVDYASAASQRVLYDKQAEVLKDREVRLRPV